VIKTLYARATGGQDTTACIFWLKNRQPERWRDRRELEGNLNVTARLSMGDFLRSIKEYDGQK